MARAWDWARAVPDGCTVGVMGGHARVGLEDNLYLKRGQFGNNGQLIENAYTLINRLGRSVAKPAQAREILHLKPARHSGNNCL
jgi:uncharacterized protein (DUF849 family)